MADTPILEPAAAYALWAANYPPRAHNPLMQAEERAMLSLLPADLGGKALLDAGCGSGRYLIHAAHRGARRLVGVDVSAEMLAQAQGLGVRGWGMEVLASSPNPHPPSSIPWLIRAGLDAIPLRDRWADITLCGLTIGHLAELWAPLAELGRVTRRGGAILCSDFHPIGHALGWRREFTVDGRRYAARHTPHLYSHWQRACAELGLRIARVLEPYLDPADIPPGARFDPIALEVPVALVFELRRE